MEQKVIAKYPALSAEEIKILVVDRKWLDTVQAAVESEVDRLSQRLAGRTKELAERYQEPLPALTADITTLSDKVDGHLKKMGFVW